MSEPRQSVPERLQQSVSAVKQFCNDIHAELHKCTWPTRDELWQSTLVVMISLALLTAFVAVLDWAGQGLIRVLTVSGG